MKKAYSCIVMLLTGLFACQGLAFAQFHGYRAATPFEEGFAVTSGERELSFLDRTGVKTGTVSLPKNISPGTIVSLGTGLLVVGGKEIICISKTGSLLGSVIVPCAGNIVGLALSERFLFGITDAGEILRSEDGTEWTVQDFNATYQGYYSSVDFRCIAVSEAEVMVAGITSDGGTAVFTSTMGEVWSPRPLNYKQEGKIYEFTGTPYGLVWNPWEECFDMLCDAGTVLSLPSCSHCNRVKQFRANELFALAFNGDRALLLGADGFQDILTR